MRKSLLFLVSLVSFSVSALAQFTTVTGTVLDPHSVPYALGTITPTLVASASPTLNGLPYTPPTQPVGLDKNGSFSFNVADNTQLQPAGTKWNFVVCSAAGTTQPVVGTGSQCFTLATPLTISGATQSISTQLNAAATALTIPIGGGGTGTITPGAAPQQAIYTGITTISGQAKPIYDVRDWATCDGVTDATSGLANLINTIGAKNATIQVIGTCVVKFMHTGTNITLDFSGGGAISLLNVVTPPGGGAFVQGSGQSNNPSSSTCTATLNGTVAGHFIVMMVSLYNTFGTSRIASVTDSTGNFYLQQQATTLGQAGYEALYVAPSIAGGNATVTANFTGTATKNACIAWEASGLGPVPKIDAGTFAYGSTTPFNSGAATLAAGDFVIGYSEDPNDAQTCTAGGGFTQPAGSAGNVSSAGPSMCAEYIANGAGGSTTATQNFSSSPVASSYVSGIVGLAPGIATLTLLGGIVNPDSHQIFFNATGTTGLVDLTGNTAPVEVRPEWWGASGQPGANVSTNAAALQAAEQAAWGCGLTTCRINGSGLNVYNKVLRFSANYQSNAELKMYHVIGAGGAARAKLYCDGGGGITQTAPNLRIIDGQSVAYFESHGCIWTGNASSTNALIDWDFSGAQGADLAPQFIDHYGETFVGNSQVDVGVLIAKSGGAAQGSNIYCHDCESINFTGAAWQSGGDNTGRNVGRSSATNALAIGYDGDIQGSPLYGIAVYGGGYVSFGGGSRLSTMENGFTTQTGFDMFCSITQGPCVMEHVRSESRKIIFCNTCQLKDVFAINQSNRPTPGNSSPVGSIFSGSQVGGDGAYYQVTIDGGNFGGTGTPTAPIRASGGSATTVANTNQTLTGSVTIKTLPGASLNETMTQAVTGATGIRLNSPANNATITGTASGAQIVLNEVMTQATTGVTCTEQAPTPVTGSNTPLTCNNFSGTADNSHAWTGGTSGGVYTPNAVPSFAAASPILVLGTVTGSPDSTHIWTGGTSGGKYTPTQAPQPANYTVNAFAGMIASIMTGTSALCYGTVASNTSTTITVGSWITRYPLVPCPGPDSTSTFIVEPGWNHGTVVSGGMTLIYMNENVIDGPNGAGGTLEDVIGYGGQWNLGASPTSRSTLRHVQVSRQDWYAGAGNTPQYRYISSLGTTQGTLVDGDWDVLVFPPGADRPQNWSSLLLGSGATAYSGATHNTVVKPFCWNAASDTQSANELCIGGRSDPASGITASRNILEFTGMLGRASPFGTDQNGGTTQIEGGLPTGAGTPGNVEFWTGNTSGSGSTVNSGTRRAYVDGVSGSLFETAAVRATQNIADQGTACTNGELALSAGWGTTATVTAVVGNGQTCEWTLTSSGTGQAANPTITDTLTNSLPAATTVCEMRMVGGTGTPTLIDQTALSATAPIFTFGGTPAAASTYKVVRRCGP